MTVDDSQQVPTSDRGPWWRQTLSALTTVVVLVLVFGFVIPQLADYGEIADRLTSIPPIWWAVLIAMAGTFAAAYPIVLETVIRSLRYREAFVNHMAGTAITNSLPSGGAIALGLNYAMYLSWGFTPESVSAGMLAAGVWDWFGRIGIPIAAVLFVALTGDATTWMWIVSIGGILLLAVSIWLLARLLGSDRAAAGIAGFIDRTAARVAGWLRRPAPAARAAVMRFRSELRSVIRTRALPVTGATTLNHVAMAGLYTVSIYAVGVSPSEIPVAWVVLSFALGRFLVMIPVSPGGLGLVDLGWIGLLTLGWETTNPGVPVDTDLIAAGVLLFRALSLLPPIPIGMASWIFWRSNSSWRRDWRTARRGDSPDLSEGPAGDELEADDGLHQDRQA